MTTQTRRFVLRVWMPDRPGSLGRVATAIGSVGASLVGIDILEQEGGYAVDELVVDAVDSSNADEKLIAALTFLEGVNVEDVRSNDGTLIDSRLEALSTAAELVEQRDVKGLLEVLVRRAQRDVHATWTTVIEFDADEPLMSSGDVPSTPWVRAFIAGSRSSDAAATGRHGPEDVAWTALHGAGAVLVLGRDRRPFRERERRQLAAIARIADCRLVEMQARERKGSSATGDVSLRTGSVHPLRQEGDFGSAN